MSAVTELAATIGAQAACGVLAVPRASYYRHRKPRTAPPRQARVRTPSPRALSEAERQVVLDTLHGERFQDRSAGHVVAALLSEDTWLCSERTMYRILAAQGETQERRRQRQHPVYVKPQLRADAPNQVWTRDYTKVRGPARGIWFHLFVLLDLFSRCVVGWTLARRPSAAVARHLLRQSMAQHNVAAGTLTVHNDRGSEFVADDVSKLFEKLDVTRSFSRPRTANDNAYSESHFKTTKYHPDYPGAFDGFEAAWKYFETFFAWYNTDHRHSGIAWLTPEVVHTGQAGPTLARHQVTKDRAYAANPERFVNGQPQVTPLPEEVWINGPPADEKNEVLRH